MISKIGQMLEFAKVDELMSAYVVFEKTYVQNALLKGTLQDN